MTNHVVFYFTKSHFLVDVINERIRIFKSSGIINYFISRYGDEKFRKIDLTNNGPSQLTVNHFIGIFQLWTFGLIVASILFSFELILHKLKKKS